MEKDALGYPKRYAGERYKYNGRIFTVIENHGLTVLCPCADELEISYDDADTLDENVRISNSPDFERMN